jgi:TrmH family RNA methyltransferase
MACGPDLRLRLLVNGTVIPADPIERFRAARRDPSLAVLEGLHVLKHALRFGARPHEVVTHDPDRLLALAATVAPDVSARLQSEPLHVVSVSVFQQLSPHPPATGVIALAARPSTSPSALLSLADPLPIVLLENPTHLGNIGAVVRVAAAAGAAGVLTTGEHDPWHPAALRGAAGLHFALPVIRIGELPPTDRPLVAIDPAGQPLRPGLLPSRSILAFGSERHGLGRTIGNRADLHVGIPMRQGVSSLNLATAAAVVLYAR